MTKRSFRYFMSFFNAQERWLNKQSADGWRLCKTTKLYYDFEECMPAEYEYRVEFVGAKSYQDSAEYRLFLEEMGYRTLTKNINLQFGFKASWRPWAKGMGQLATTMGSYNREILIIEKKRDGKPFELHTRYDDLVEYYRPIRNMYLNMLALPVLFMVLDFALDLMALSLTHFVLLGMLSLSGIIPATLYTGLIIRYKKLGKTTEYNG